MTVQCFVEGTAANADFTLKIHRGEGMALIAMSWRSGPPPANFVGFGIEYAEPGSTNYFAVKNRLTFEGNAGTTPSAGRPDKFSTLIAPIQKFRWVHFPRNANLPGDYSYRVTPVFMAADGMLSYGVAQTAALPLARETIAGVLNIAFTRGFVSSQAFIDYYAKTDEELKTLVPPTADEGMEFEPRHPRSNEAYAWMGFEARAAMLQLLKDAVADTSADVGVVAYDLNLPEVVDLLKQLSSRARVIIDNSDPHVGGAEDEAAEALEAAGVAVVRQRMGALQHNKTVYVDGAIKRVLAGSTNMSWRGLFVQSNNVMIADGAEAVKVFKAAFDSYWNNPGDFPAGPSAEWNDLKLDGVDAKIAFSPHSRKNSVLAGIGADVASASSSVFYSLAFLAITPGVIREALSERSGHDDIFVAGIADQRAGVAVASGSSNLPPTYVVPLARDAPAPFGAEPTGLAGGVGTRMHHKFIVVDFDTPDARVYLGSYNMSKGADGKNGDNVTLIRDRRVATSYMIEAVRMIDHYQFRAALKNKPGGASKLTLKRPPAAADEEPWWAADYRDARAIKDRELFA